MFKGFGDVFFKTKRRRGGGYSEHEDRNKDTDLTTYTASCPRRLQNVKT
jgi:hypothetical protein